MAQKYEYLTPAPAYTESEYLEQLRKLLPPGPIWGFLHRVGVSWIRDIIGGPGIKDRIGVAGIQDTIFDPTQISGHVFGRFLSVFAAELSRMETRARTLMREMVTGLSAELLQEWEAVAGITPSGDVNSRQLTAHAVLWGGYQTTTPAFFMSLADSMGFTVTLEEGSGWTSDTRMGVAITGLNRVGAKGGQNKAVIVTVWD